MPAARSRARTATVPSRLRPIRASVTAVVGRPMELSALNIRCAVPNGNVTVTVEPGRPDRHAARRRRRASTRRPATASTPDSGRRPRKGRSPSPSPAPTSSPCRCWPAAYTVDAGAVRRSRDHRNAASDSSPASPARSRRRSRCASRGGSFTTLFVDERGAVQFDGGGFNADLAAVQRAAALAVPLDADRPVLGPDPSRSRPECAEVVWEVTGTAPNRELVVEWRNLRALRPSSASCSRAT